MSRASFSLRVDPKKVEAVLNEAMSDLLTNFNTVLTRSLPEIKAAFQRLTKKVMKEGRMYYGLTAGDLGGQFGIPEPEINPTAEKIVDIIANNVEVEVSRVQLAARTLSGRLTFILPKKIYDDLRSEDFAYVLTEKGEILPWIDWSLFRGDDIIIEDYGILVEVGRGRSGMAIMLKNFGHGFWKVPDEIAGTEDDNWITREIEKYRATYTDFVRKLLDAIIRKIT
jgi:hypothetical protein